MVVMMKAKGWGVSLSSAYIKMCTTISIDTTEAASTGKEKLSLPALASWQKHDFGASSLELKHGTVARHWNKKNEKQEKFPSIP